MIHASKLGWACWALVPVAALAIHFGPGQDASVRDRAAALQASALAAEADAAALQESAYAAHLQAIEARRAALLEEGGAAKEREGSASAAEAGAYAAAAAAWKQVAERHDAVLEVLGDRAPAEAREVRAARARALVRSGEVWSGIEELEAVVGALDEEGQGSTPTALAAREELATAFYYGARLLRLSGMAPQEWMVESGKARQHFRFLAEQARRSPDGASRGVDGDGTLSATERHQRNVEIVLNLEQSSSVELQGRPLPKDCPCNGNVGSRKNSGKKPGRKPGSGKDARGAGAAEPVTDGW